MSCSTSKNKKSSGKKPGTNESNEKRDDQTGVKETGVKKQKYEDEREGQVNAEIGYVHDLSPLTRNKKNLMDYCTLKLQTSPNTFKDALLYSPTKRKMLKASETSRTPIKVEKFTYTDDKKKIIINDIARLSTPDQNEYAFQYAKFTPENDTFTTIQDVLDNANEYDMVNVKAKVFQKQKSRVVSGNLEVATALLSDGKATITIDIWSPHVSVIEEKKAYSFKSLTVRSWNGKKLSFGRRSQVFDLTGDPITLVTEEQIDKAVGDETGSTNIENISSISSIEIYPVCVHCKKKVIQVSAGPILHCDHCGHSMKSSKCEKSVLVLFEIEDEEKQPKTLTVFRDQLLKIMEHDIIFQKAEIEKALLMASDVDIKYNKKSLIVTEFVEHLMT